MHDLAPITALGGTVPRVDTVGKVSVTENPGIALACVAARLGKESACRKHMSKLLGGPAPEPGRAHLGARETALWMGPEQWMICAPFKTHEDLAAQLLARFGKTASVTEQTDAWACFELAGKSVEAVMELLCNVDTRRMKTGDAARTSIHHMGCFVTRLSDDALQIMGPRSSAGSLHHAVLAAMHTAI